MEPKQDSRSLIQSLSPGHEALVDSGLSDAPVFRELCEDYRRCFVALENLRQRSGTAHPERILEYEELLTQLAREVEESLEALLHGQT